MKVEVVRLQTIAQTIDLTGSVEPTSLARVASPAEGPVQNCRLREGDTVKAGEVLLAIGRSKTADAMLKSAQQDLIREEQELKRVEQLVKSLILIHKSAFPAPTGLRPKAQGCEARATLGKRIKW